MLEVFFDPSACLQQYQMARKTLQNMCKTKGKMAIGTLLGVIIMSVCTMSTTTSTSTNGAYLLSYLSETKMKLELDGGQEYFIF